MISFCWKWAKYQFHFLCLEMYRLEWRCLLGEKHSSGWVLSGSQQESYASTLSLAQPQAWPSSSTHHSFHGVRQRSPKHTVQRNLSLGLDLVHLHEGSVCVCACVCVCVCVCVCYLINVSDSFDPRYSSTPGSSVLGILQARISELLAISFSKGSSQPRNWIQVSFIDGRYFTIWEVQLRPYKKKLCNLKSLSKVCLFTEKMTWPEVTAGMHLQARAGRGPASPSGGPACLPSQFAAEVSFSHTTCCSTLRKSHCEFLGQSRLYAWLLEDLCDSW